MSPLRRSFVALSLSLPCLVAGCATGSGIASSSASSDEATSTSSQSPDFGHDPLGVARGWVRGKNDAGDTSLRKTVESFESPGVARVYRTGETRYRAVVADRTGGNTAVLVTLERDGDGRWRVVDTERTESTHLWPKM